MKLVACGDAIIQRRIQSDFVGYSELTPYIEDADARFFNLETTLNREGECYASQFSGGTYIRCVPEVLSDLMRFGFNMTTFNNNHALDFSYDGLLRTLEHLEDSGIVHSGVGYNLDDASEPRYLETNAGRVALIAVNTSFKEPMLAGVQSRRVPGRPGINGLRVEKHINVTKDELDFIRGLADRTRINIEREIETKEGYFPPVADDEAVLGTMKFRLAEETAYVMQINPVDMARLERSIYEAKFQADYVMVSVHSHEISGKRKEDPADFLVKLAHDCIDLGANAVVGHGPHLLRPIEIYKDSPIFYSLGDFVLQLYNVPMAPADFYQKHGVEVDAPVRDLLAHRSHDFTVGLMTDPRMFLSVIPKWECEGGKVKRIELLPICGKMYGSKSDIGLPGRVGAEAVFDYLSDMCEPYGTKLKITKDGTIEVIL